MGILNFKFNENKVNDERLLSLIEVDKERLYRIAYAHVKNEDDAKEIVQESVYKAFLNIKKLKDVDSFQGWITRILVNTSMDFIKKIKKFTLVGEETLLNYPSKENNYLELYEAIDTLQGMDKTVIILKYFEDYRIKDIGSILKISESKVKNHIHGGLKKLRIELQEENQGFITVAPCKTT